MNRLEPLLLILPLPTHVLWCISNLKVCSFEALSIFRLREQHIAEW
jgi:hypothetical protein